MNWKRVVLLVLVMALAGTAGAFASEAVQWYKGKEVAVEVNGEKLDTPGLLLTIDGVSKTLLPLRAIADTLQAIVRWEGDTQTVKLYKPNVHIALSTQNKDGSFGMFGTVYHKTRTNFFVFAQIDSLMTDIHSVKFEIVDPKNEVVYESEHVVKKPVDDILWLRTGNISMYFHHLGNYKVKVYMKSSEKAEYFLVSEKVFNSISK